MVPRVGEVSPVASGAHSVLGPPKEHRDLRDIERVSAVLEHVWNKTAVHRWGPFVILRPFRSYSV